MASENILVSVEGVTFGYDENPVLTDITFSIQAGDFLSILGPNGSGKTTLVKVILGLFRPYRGCVRIMGSPVEEFKDWRKIGYIPQKATHIDPFFPVSAREVVAMALYSGRNTLRRRKKEDSAAIESALQLVGMEEYIDQPIGSLSGGQQQRIFIARALVNSPRLLFLDEPTAGVDAQTHDHFYEILNSLNKHQGITIVLITHDIGIVNKHVTRVACLNQRLVYHGSHEEFCSSQACRDLLAGEHHLISHTH